jgi:hypothetical protein
MLNQNRNAWLLKQVIDKSSATNPIYDLPKLPAAGAIRVAEMFSEPAGSEWL